MRISKALLFVTFVLTVGSVSQKTSCQTRDKDASEFVKSPSQFRVDFGGAVVHVFNGINHAVAINLPLHTPILYASLLDNTSISTLKAKLNRDAMCGSDFCFIDLNGLRVRVVPTGQGFVLPLAVQHTTGGTFDSQVPHLQKIALNQAQYPFDDVKPEVKGKVATGVVSAIFEYTGGILKSDPHTTCKSRYEPDPHVPQPEFTSGVYLEGFTTTPVLLELSSTTQTVTLSFLNSNSVVIGFTNGTVGTVGTCTSHLQMHSIIASRTGVKLPTVVSTGCQCGLGLAPGCSNTQWP